MGKGGSVFEEPGVLGGVTTGQNVTGASAGLISPDPSRWAHRPSSAALSIWASTERLLVEGYVPKRGGGHHDRSQTASREVRLVRACVKGRQEGAGFLQRGARVDRTTVPHGSCHVRDDPRRRHHARRLCGAEG